MHITERELRGLVGAADDLHHAIPLASVGEDSDASLAAFAASVEHALVAAYGIGAPKLRGAAQAMATTFATHHRDHAGAFTAAAGAPRAGFPASSRLAADLAAPFRVATTQTAVLEAAFAAENVAAATYQNVLNALRGSTMIRLTASVMPVEGQHAVVIGTVLGKDLKRDLVAGSSQTTVGFLDPDKYPVAG